MISEYPYMYNYVSIEISLVNEPMRLDIISYMRLAHVMLLGLAKHSILTEWKHRDAESEHVDAS